MVLKILLLLLGGICAVQAAVPLLLTNATNPRWLINSYSGRGVLLAGSHVWQTGASVYSNTATWPAWTNATYLNVMATNNHNAMRYWPGVSIGIGSWNDTYATRLGPKPWNAVGPGIALDGGLRYSLSPTNFHQPWFDAVRWHVQAANTQGVYVAVVLEHGSKVSFPSWTNHLFHASNNIHGITVTSNEINSLASAELMGYWRAYIVKMIDTLNDLDNVIWEIANECPDWSVAWQYDLINCIRTNEATRAKQHLVCMSSVGFLDAYNTNLVQSTAEILQPSGFETLNTNSVIPVTSNRVVIADTDHITGSSFGETNWNWKAFCRGYNPIFMDRLHGVSTLNLGDIATAPAMRREMGQVKLYGDKINLLHMMPSNSLANTGHCLAHTAGGEYLVFQPTNGSTFIVNVSAGSYEWETYNPETSAVTKSGILNLSAGNNNFAFPAGVNYGAVLYLRKIRQVTCCTDI